MTDSDLELQLATISSHRTRVLIDTDHVQPYIVCATWGDGRIMSVCTYDLADIEMATWHETNLFGALPYLCLSIRRRGVDQSAPCDRDTAVDVIERLACHWGICTHEQIHPMTGVYTYDTPPDWAVDIIRARREIAAANTQPEDT